MMLVTPLSDRVSQEIRDKLKHTTALMEVVLPYFCLNVAGREGSDCFDNVAMESWNHSFKVEAIHGEKLTTRALTKSHVFEYIEIYYNRKRLHSRIGYETPESFELKMVA